MVNIDKIVIAKSVFSGNMFIGERKYMKDNVYEWAWRYPVKLAIGSAEDHEDMLLIGAVDDDDRWIWAIEFKDLIGSENYKIITKEKVIE